MLSAGLMADGLVVSLVVLMVASRENLKVDHWADDWAGCLVVMLEVLSVHVTAGMKVGRWASMLVV